MIRLSSLPQVLRRVYAKPLRVIGSLTNELEAYTSELPQYLRRAAKR